MQTFYSIGKKISLEYESQMRQYATIGAYSRCLVERPTKRGYLWRNYCQQVWIWLRFSTLDLRVYVCIAETWLAIKQP